MASPQRRVEPRQLAAEILDDDAPEEQTGGITVFLSEGDALTARVAEEVRTPTGSVWFTVGATTAVRPEEIEGVSFDDDENVVEVYGFARARLVAEVLSALEELREQFRADRKRRAQQRRPTSSEEGY